MRIISGIWRGRTLNVPPGVRATTDRVREAIFSILGEAQGLNVLDLFAGSGALGIEALSRSARGVCFVDASRRAMACIQRNLPQESIEACRLVRQDALIFLRKSETPFDWIFCDPPYLRVDYDKLLQILEESAAFGANSLLILETDRFHTLAIPPELTRIDQRKFGDTVIHFLKRAVDDQPEYKRA